MRSLKIAAVVGLSTTLLACAADDPNRRAKTGAVIGAVVGAVVGHQVSHDKGRYVGAAVGAVAGAVAGDYMDKQQQAFEQELATERSNNQLEVERVRDDLLKLSLSSEVSFDFNKAELKPAFLPSLDKLAEVMRKYDRTTIQVVGHTDSKGSDAYNLDLSRRRAQAVADYLATRGVGYGRVSVEGRGEGEPRATNDTEAGRQLNRRVEIFIKPVLDDSPAAAPAAHEPPPRDGRSGPASFN